MTGREGRKKRKGRREGRKEGKEGGKKMWKEGSYRKEGREMRLKGKKIN